MKTTDNSTITEQELFQKIAITNMSVPGCKECIQLHIDNKQLQCKADYYTADNCQVISRYLDGDTNRRN